MKLNFILGMVVISVVPAFAQSSSSEVRSCSNSSLRGSYGFTAEGTTSSASDLAALLTKAFASSGTAEFDGAGHFTLTATSSFGGLITGPGTVKGTYSVNKDCSYTSKAENGAFFRAVIVEGGHELLILQTNKGVTISGVADRQGDYRELRHDYFHNKSKACSNEAFSGSYGFLAKGYAGAPTLPGLPFAPLAGVGVVNLRPNGTFLMMAQRSVNGALDPQPLPLTGTYSLSGNCTAHLTFDFGFHFTAAIVNHDEAVFIETDPGTALTVRAKRID